MTTMNIPALEIYRVGGKFYAVLVKDAGGYSDYGTLLIDSIPTDPAVFKGNCNPHSPIDLPLIFRIDWKSSKIEYYAQENIRLRPLPISYQGRCGRYIEKPGFHFTNIPSGIKWAYIIDLDMQIFRVMLVGYSSRMYRLDNIPRWLFQLAAGPSPGSRCFDDGKHLLLDPVDRSHLSVHEVLSEPDQTFLALYHSRTPKLCARPSPPGADAFPIRQQFRLVLLMMFYNGQRVMFHHASYQRTELSIPLFYLLAYTGINLTRSRVEVRLEPDQRYNGSSKSIRRKGKSTQYKKLPSTPECWMDGVLVVVEPDLSTKENHHAAIGKVIHLMSARAGSHVVDDNTRPTAIICSLCSIVLVYIRGEEVTYTPNMEFFPHHNSRSVDTVASEGIFALFDIFYRPAQLADPVSFPSPFNHHLPTEICQNIFSRACPATRTALETSCRLFRLISHDHGLHVINCYLQKRSAEKGSTAFLGECYDVPEPVPPGIDSRDPEVDVGPMRGEYTRRTIVEFIIGQTRFGPVYGTFLVMPDSNIVRLDMPVQQMMQQL